MTPELSVWLWGSLSVVLHRGQGLWALKIAFSWLSSEEAEWDITSLVPSNVYTARLGGAVRLLGSSRGSIRSVGPVQEPRPS